MVLDFVLWLAIGVVAGLYAGRLMGSGGYGRYGVLGNMAAGVIGAIAAGVATRVLSIGGPYGNNDFSWPSLALAAIGSIVGLGVMRATARGAARS